MARNIRSIQVEIGQLGFARMGRDAPVVRDGERRGNAIWKVMMEGLLAERLGRGGSILPPFNRFFPHA